jgi:hypothetical protein
MRGALLRLNDLVLRSADLRIVIARVREARLALQALHESYARELPSAWQRWMNGRGLNDSSLATAMSLDEVEDIEALLEVGEERLTKWKEEVENWIRERPSRDEVSLLTGDRLPDVPMTGLEARYELLLRLASADRRLIQDHTARQIRGTMLWQIERVAASGALSVNDPAFRLAKDFASVSCTSVVEAEEIGAYHASLVHFFRRAVERVRNG